MTRKLIRLAMTAAGLSLAVGTFSACSDDSTATAPITSNPVTTTSMYASSPTAASSAVTAPSSATNQTSSPGAAAGSGLPATAPATKTTTEQNMPAPDGAPLSDKGKKYLSTLKSDNVSFMGDTDNNIALTMAEYICAEQRKGTDPVTVKAFITASVGPGTKTVAEANDKADKVIRAAHDDYC